MQQVLVKELLIVELLCLFLQTHLQSQRALLIQGTESLNNASKSIERSQQIAAETDQIGTDIIEELGEQREQLDRTRDRVSKRYLDHSPLLLLLNEQIINCTSEMSRMNSLLLFFSSVGSHWRELEPQQENPAHNVQTVRLAHLWNTFYITRIISKSLSENILNQASFPVISDWWRTNSYYQSLSSWSWPS